MTGTHFQLMNKLISGCLFYHGSKRYASRIGFIGLGNMGGHMARNLIAKGHQLSVFDTNPEAVASLVKEGAVGGKCPAHVTESAKCVITMLPNSSHVLTTYKGPNGIFESLQSGTLLIDSSTIDPGVCQKLCELTGKKGSVFLDAPVSGGVNGAKSGTLTFMVGGSATEFERAKKILLCMGSRVVHCGSAGLGQVAKLCNNMVLAITMVATAEAMNLGCRLGIETKLLADIFNTSTARSWTSESYSPVPGIMENVPSSNNYQGGFATHLMAKDLGIIQNIATSSQTPILLGAAVHQLYRIMAVRGFAKKDFSSVYEFISKIDEHR